MADLDPIVLQLAEERIRRGLSQREVAELAGVTQSAVSEWETGAVVARVDSLRRHAAALGFRLSITLEPADGSVVPGVPAPPLGAPGAPHGPVCCCPLIDVSADPLEPAFVLGHPAGCPIHGGEYDARVQAAEAKARRAAEPSPSAVGGAEGPPERDLRSEVIHGPFAGAEEMDAFLTSEAAGFSPVPDTTPEIPDEAFAAFRRERHAHWARDAHLDGRNEFGGECCDRAGLRGARPYLVAAEQERAEKAERERDSLVRRLGVRFGELEEARAELRQMRDERDREPTSARQATAQAALIAAWPNLAADPVHVEQLAAVALNAAYNPAWRAGLYAGLFPGTGTPPKEGQDHES